MKDEPTDEPTDGVGGFICEPTDAPTDASDLCLQLTACDDLCQEQRELQVSVLESTVMLWGPLFGRKAMCLSYRDSWIPP